MDEDGAIRTLLAWFGNERFRVNEISNDQLHEIAELLGVAKQTVQGTRMQLGKQLTKMDGYRCGTEPHKGATLVAIRVSIEIEPRPNAYQILPQGSE